MSDRDTADAALLAELREHGALINAVPRLRPDGIRGLYATKDLDAEEMACWIPNTAVLELSSCEAELRRSIAETLVDQLPGCGEVERNAYSRMMALTVGFLLEKARGSASRFHRYIDALPQYPPTVNTFTPAERRVLAIMNENNDFYAMYTPLINLAFEAVRQGSALWGDAAVPSRADVEAAFFFVFSRMSHMRMIPLCDLANAALPNQENARIAVEDQVVDGVEGCAVVTKKHVAAGEELVIDYKHPNAIGMLTIYGCTLGLEKLVCSIKMCFSLPEWLYKFGGSKYAEGIPLRVDEPTGVDDEALTLSLMGALGGVDELILAIQAGYFQDPPSPSGCSHENVPKWDACQRKLLNDISSFCLQRCEERKEMLEPLLVDIDKNTFAGQVIMSQYDTDMRVLQRCAEAMQERMAAISVKYHSSEKLTA